MQSLEKLPNLRSLKFLAKSYLGKKMVCSLGGFSQLRVLKLWKLEQLEEWDVKMLPAELQARTLLKIEVKAM